MIKRLALRGGLMIAVTMMFALPSWAWRQHDCDAVWLVEEVHQTYYVCGNVDAQGNPYPEVFCDEEDGFTSPSGADHQTRENHLHCNSNSCDWTITILCGGRFQSATIHAVDDTGHLPACSESLISGGTNGAVYTCNTGHAVTECSCQVPVGASGNGYTAGVFECSSGTK